MALGQITRIAIALAIAIIAMLFLYPTLLVGQEVPEAVRNKHDTLIRAVDTMREDINHYTNQLFRLETQARQLANHLQVERELASTSFAAMQRLSMSPRPTALIDPRYALDYTRAQSLLAHIRPDTLLHETQTLSALDELRRLQKRRSAIFQALSETEKRHDVLAKELGRLVAESGLASDLPSQAETTYLTDDDQNLMADQALPGTALSHQVPSSDAFEPIDSVRDYDRKKHKLLFPLNNGIIKSTYSNATASLQFRHGVIIHASNVPTHVVAPFDSRVIFSESIEGYGLTLILQHSKEVVSILSGLDKVNVGVGQWVHQADVIGRVAEHRGSLFWQLRDKKRLVDPMSHL